MKKRILSLLSIITIVSSMFSYSSIRAEAADMPQEYKYWATAISSYVRLEGGGMSYSIGGGGNFRPDNNLHPGYPYNEYISGTINSNDYLPPDYIQSDNRWKANRLHLPKCSLRLIF